MSTTRGAACALSPKQSAGRGVTWLVAGFLFCPCHLPLTLMLLATAFSGTALGALLTGHSYVAGTLITIVWIGMSWRGLRYLQAMDGPKA
jgi:Fe2+ transport system protein B